MDTERLSELLDEGCAVFGVPGAQLGLLQGVDRQVLCVGTRAVGEDSPVDHGTAFHAGSIAKSLAALLVVDAAARGELDLDVPCGQQADGLWDDTPRALMAQTTGRPNILPEPDEDIDAFVARVGAMPRVHHPGLFSYCNAGWSVLDVLLRERTGAGFEQLAADRVLGEGATFGQPEGAAAGHAVAPGVAPYAVPGEFAVAASAAGSRWWATANQLLDYARLHLDDGVGLIAPDAVREMRRPHAPVPAATVSDSWGLGWALWDRAEHRAFGWAGYTGGHRAYLRCFPEQDAAVVLLANSAGPLFGPPGGSALFDALLPVVLDVLGAPSLEAPYRPDGRADAELVGGYGPLTLSAGEDGSMMLDAAAFGEPEPLVLHRAGGDAFELAGSPPGGMTVAVVDDLLYVGPFALPRNG
ncbi:MAG: serine hydrolase [Propionibacteriales bacterium]|nr:serine hydrolase [Propionibacteriales bacterium]